MSNPTAYTTSTARVRTSTPARYAKQLVSHLGRKTAFAHDEAAGTWTTTAGLVTGTIAVGDHELVLTASGPDAATTAQVEHALGSHLERFGAKQELSVTWQRDDA